ncbi:MAG: hypothetical protein WCK29_00255 [archaeon]
MDKIKNVSFLKFISISVGLVIVFIGIVPFHTQALSLSPIRYEISGNPGDVLQEQLNLRNETSNPETYYPHYYNFQAEGESGVPTFVAPKDGLGTWIAGPAGISLAPGDNQTIVFVISIPKDAHPGGYFGALLYGTTPPRQDGAQLAIGSETGPIILLRVNGDIKESASILEFNTKDNAHFFNALPVSMYYRFQNTGADRTKPLGDLTIRNIFGIKAKKQTANPVEGNVLPGQIRRIDLSWQKKDVASSPLTYADRSFFEQVSYEWHNFAFGYFTANLDLTYGKDNNQTSHSEVKFTVFPWQLLLVILIILFFIFIILKTLMRKYNHWIINQAEIALEHEHEVIEKREHKHHHEEHEEEDSLKHRV